MHALEAVAEAEIQRAHELVVARVVARVGDTCAVRPAISGMAVAAENTIDQTNRKIEFLKLDLGYVASLFMCITQQCEVLSRKSSPSQCRWRSSQAFHGSVVQAPSPRQRNADGPGCGATAVCG